MKDICYKENPIKEAIARIDFLNSIEEFKNEIPNEISNKIKKLFPIAESKETISKELRIEPNNEVKHIEIKGIEWNFFDKERAKRLCITNSTMFIIYYKYDKFDSFYADYKHVLDSLYQYKPDIQLKRFGIRYINNIKFNEGDPLDWSKYLDPKLLSIFDIPSEKKTISRAFQNIELNCGDYNVRFQYGMHNPDYPAVIKKKVFILDFDAYYGGIMSKADIEEFFPKFHNAIQDLFEKSITDEYRKVLNNE